LLQRRTLMPGHSGDQCAAVERSTINQLCHYVA
jgi:hypothetical protein